MKMQVQGQSVRLRLSEDELGSLLVHGEFSDVTALGSMAPWVRRLLLVEGDSPGFQREGDVWCFLIPRPGFEIFAAERPRRDGHGLVIPGGDGDAPLELSVEVDVRDSRKRLRAAGVGQD